MPWEEDPLKTITNEKQLNSYKHHGFWQPMDTIRKEQFLKICTHQIKPLGLHGR